MASTWVVCCTNELECKFIVYIYIYAVFLFYLNVINIIVDIEASGMPGAGRGLLYLASKAHCFAALRLSHPPM